MEASTILAPRPAIVGLSVFISTTGITSARRELPPLAQLEPRARLARVLRLAPPAPRLALLVPRLHPQARRLPVVDLAATEPNSSTLE